MSQLSCFAVLACGGSGPELPPPRPIGPPAAVVGSSAGPDDVVVAQVAGRPVWGSCVATQARRGVELYASWFEELERLPAHG